MTFTLTLKEQIVKYINTFRVVDEKALHKFFSSWSLSDIEFVMNQLKAHKYIHPQSEGRFSCARNLHAPASRFDGIVDAQRVMASSGSSFVEWYLALDYPFELIYGTTSNEVYCVSSFDADNWVVKAGLTEIARERIRVPDTEDSIIYVAAIHDLDLMDKLDYLGFTYFAHILPDGQVEIYD